MGLSSSQARLLNLTARMHQIEYKAARLEAMKLQMANESTRVYEEYLDALDKTKLQKKTLTQSGAVTYVDFTSYGDFLSAGYALVVHGLPSTITYKTGVTYTENGQRVYYTKAEADALKSEHPEYWFTESVTKPGYYVRGSLQEYTAGTYNGSYTCREESSLIAAVKEIFKDSDGNGIDITNALANDFSTLLVNLVNSGNVTIATSFGTTTDSLDGWQYTNQFYQPSNPNFADYETSVATNTGLQEVTDEVNLKKAEAKYEADMKRIDMKDRKYDTDLAAMDAERNAVKQEMETLKTVAKDNVERTFKLFS